jgi:cytochrome c-type biogenesis protein CcmE
MEEGSFAGLHRFEGERANGYIRRRRTLPLRPRRDLSSRAQSMKRDHRFFAGLVGVGLVVSWLVWTGISETMVFYYTPTELVAKAAGNPALHDVGVKVSGRVVEGSYARASGMELVHTFSIVDLDDPHTTLSVEFRNLLPDTFVEDGEVVLEGRYRPDGVFEAAVVLTKCGSRYEAAIEDLAA